VEQVAELVTSLGERLERLERGNSHEGLKDAIKALHQGLSRLADQITQTATQSATQISALAGSLDQLASRLDEVREGAASRAEALALRLSAVESTALEARQVVDEALEKLDLAAIGRIGTSDESPELHHAFSAQLAALEERIAQLGPTGPDPALER